MSDELRCPFCEQAVAGLTLYLAAGGFRLMVCARCYQVLVSKEHQPYSTPMRRLRRVLWGFPRKEVVSDEGVAGSDAATGDGAPPVVGGHADRGAVRPCLAVGDNLDWSSKEVRPHGAAT